MANPVPNALDLSVINTGDTAQSAPLRNNFSALQSFANLIRACLAGGTAGNVLQAADGTDTQWVDPKTVSRYLNQSGRSSGVSTAGTTFAGGVDALSSPLSFTADGTSSYLVVCRADTWTNSAVNANHLRLNLDGADGGFMAQYSFAVAGGVAPLTGSIEITTPTAGTHTINVRLNAGSGGTATINGGAGGAGNHGPLVVTVEKL